MEEHSLAFGMDNVADLAPLVSQNELTMKKMRENLD